MKSGGKQYADDATVRPIDGGPLPNRRNQRMELPPPPTVAQASFNAKLISPIFSAGSYRVFLERSDLIFIQIEGGVKSILAAVAPLFGPFGNLIPLALWLFTKRKAKDRLKNLDRQNPEDLLRESGRNFKLHLSEIRDAAFEPPASLAIGGKAGRLNLVVRHGEKMKLEFVDAAEMKNAMHLLAPLLNSTLSINVEWNGAKQQFENKKTI
jgi:hypothetical protein